jgi:hypothetical protein
MARDLGEYYCAHCTGAFITEQVRVVNVAPSFASQTGTLGIIFRVHLLMDAPA